MSGVKITVGEDRDLEILAQIRSPCGRSPIAGAVIPSLRLEAAFAAASPGVAEIGLGTGPRLSRARSTVHGVPRPGERRAGDRNSFHNVDNWLHPHIIPEGKLSCE
jgi:hypothetical protein